MVLYYHQWSFQLKTAVSNEPMLQLDLLLRQNTLKHFIVRGKTTKNLPQRRLVQKTFGPQCMSLKMLIYP